ncbi:hypothetical protein HPB50_025471 [Hyalomma asiaticum]|uniref:Uncharacterized protein n=1 Tax=Hyalomma asiaticum TaxID=266040 RepID=A0ACB7SEJ8_HYAAI|nr:hypothetical protein HPB50_025471 [Hyalomma asiaticum]
MGQKRRRPVCPDSGTETSGVKVGAGEREKGSGSLTSGESWVPQRCRRELALPLRLFSRPRRRSSPAAILLATFPTPDVPDRAAALEVRARSLLRHRNEEYRMKRVSGTAPAGNGTTSETKRISVKTAAVGRSTRVCEKLRAESLMS